MYATVNPVKRYPSIAIPLVVVAALLFSFSLVVQGCAKNVRVPPQNLVIREDHAGLVTYYNEQAQDLREDAKLWDMLAELYERQAEIYGLSSAPSPSASRPHINFRRGIPFMAHHVREMLIVPIASQRYVFINCISNSSTRHKHTC